MSRRRQRRLMRQLGLRRGRGLRIVIGLIVIFVIIAGATWVWEAWNRSMHPGVTDADTAVVFLAGAVVTLVIGEVLAAGRRAVRKDDDRPGAVAMMGEVVVLPVPALALWAAVGWLPWTAHYGVPAIVTLVLIPVVGWSVASQIASYSRATAPVAEVLEPIRRHLIVPILGVLTGTGAWTALTLTWGSPGVVALIGWTLLTASTASGILAGVVIAREHRGDENLAGQVAAVLGVPDAKLAEMRWWIDRRSRIHIRGPLPASAINNLPDLNERIVSRLPSHEVGEASASMIVLVPVTKATRDAREFVGDTDGYVAAETEIPAPPVHRPDARLWELTEKARVTTGPAVDVQARKRGLTVVEYSPEAHTAVVAALDPETRLLRDRVADALKSRPWDVELTVTHGDGHIEAVEVLRAPVIQPTKRRLETWHEIIASVIPDGSAGWEIEDRPVLGELTLRWGPVPELPHIVPGADVLPEEAGGPWWLLPLGVSTDGTTVSADLKAGPHSLVVGGTGAGKSVTLRLMMLAALARGFEVVIIDPVKRAGGLKSFRSWTKAIVTRDTESAAEALEAIYAEVRRRVDLVEKVELPEGEEAEDWTDLPGGTVRPWLVVIDEYSSLVDVDQKPQGLEKDDPAMLDWQAEATAKGQIRLLVQRIALQARSAGIHLVISTQRPDAADIGGKVRDNLGTALQLVNPSRPPSPQALRMVFSDEHAESAVEQMTLLNDGVSRGFAISHITGGEVQGFRVGLVEPREVHEFAERWEVPAGVPLEMPEREDEIDRGPEPVGGRARAREQRRAGKAGGDARAVLRELQRLDAERAAAAAGGGGEDWASVEPPDSIEPDEPWLTVSPAWQYDND